MGKNKTILPFHNNVGCNGSYHGYRCPGSIELPGDSLYDHDNFHPPPNVQFSNGASELDVTKKLIK